MFGKRKGISTFIATLLLMVLAVSAGVVIYAYTMGYMGGFGGTDTLGAISLDEATMAGTTPFAITAYIRNIGKTDVEIVTAYVDGVQCTAALVGTPSLVVSEGAVNQIVITPPTLSPVVSAGKTYEVKIICEDNTQLSFSVKCGG
jgi:hypothetical protein